jgi:predicted permease
MLRKLILLFGRKRAEDDLEDELRLHLQLRALQLRDAGSTEPEAATQAVRQFGNRTAIEEQVRDAWSWMWLEHLLRDLRFAARALRKHAAFSAIAIASLALALGANTTIFAFARAIVIKKLPVRGADRLVILRQRNEMFHMENCCFTFRVFQELRKRDLGFEDLLAVKETDVDLTGEDQSEKVTAELVSGNYFRMLGVRPVLGRLIGDADDAPGGARVCVISYRLWQERYGGRQEAIGRRANIDGVPFEIVGVTARGFTGAALHEAHDIELPASALKVVMGEDRDAVGWAEVMGRLRPGVTPAEAAARLNAVGLEVEKQTGLNFSPKDLFRLADGSQGLDSKKEQFGRPVLLLFALVAVVLIVACANLTALLLVRSVERAPEAGVRMALGASRAALVRHFLAESLALAVAGGAAGWFVAYALTRALLKILGPDGEGLAPHVRADPALFAFSAAATLLAGAVFGWLPAWRAAQCDPLDAIRRRQTTRGWAMPSRALLSGQIALSLALLFGAGLFVRTLHNLRAIDIGFRPENVLLLHLDVSHTPEGSEGAGPFFEELLRRLGGVS